MKGTKVIRILIIAGSMHVGGLENQLMHLVRNADRTCFRFDFTSERPDAYYREKIEQLGCGYILLPYKSREHPIRYCRFMMKVMKEGHYDVVHAHELFHSGMTLFLAWLAGVPCRYAHAHSCREGSKGDEKTSWLRLLYRFCMRFLIRLFSTRFIACSSWAGAFLFGARIQRRENYSLIYNSVDTKQFLSMYGKPGTGECCDEGWINILHVGRFTPLKNQLFLVSVAELMYKSQMKIRILCAGSGKEDYEAAIREQIREKNLYDYMILLGARDDINELMRKSKVFLLPSEYEGMPLVLIEAQCSGLPCVVNDTFSHEVDFGLGLVAWLKPGSSAQDWYDEILRALDKPHPALELVEKAVQDGGFDSKLFADRICKLYEADLQLKQL